MSQMSSRLRVVNRRLTTTPADHLTEIAPYLAMTIKECAGLFDESLSESQDVSVPIHHFKTQLSTLLQDKSPDKRFTAMVLIKATVDVGDWHILHGAGSWVRGLLNILAVSNLASIYITQRIPSL